MDVIDQQLESYIPPPMKAPRDSVTTVNAMLALADSVRAQTAQAAETNESVRELVHELRRGDRIERDGNVLRTAWVVSLAVVLSTVVCTGFWLTVPAGLVVLK